MLLDVVRWWVESNGFTFFPAPLLLSSNKAEKYFLGDASSEEVAIPLQTKPWKAFLIDERQVLLGVIWLLTIKSYFHKSIKTIVAKMFVMQRKSNQFLAYHKRSCFVVAMVVVWSFLPGENSILVWQCWVSKLKMREVQYKYIRFCEARTRGANFLTTPLKIEGMQSTNLPLCLMNVLHTKYSILLFAVHIFI